MPRIFYVGNDVAVKTEIENSSSYSRLASSDDIRAALLVALGSHFDIFVVDRELSSVTAVGLCRVIRELDPQATIITISPDEADGSLVAAGCSDKFLHKPEGLDHLSETIGDLGPNAVKKHRPDIGSN